MNVNFFKDLEGKKSKNKWYSVTPIENCNYEHDNKHQTNIKYDHFKSGNENTFIVHEIRL